MNGKGGCCIARYGGGGGGMYGMSKVDRIMLKFRPIAPKPVADRSGSGGSTTENSDGYVKCVRSKRKYVRVNKNKKKKDNSKSEKMKVKTPSPPVVTLSLLPETPDRKDNSPDTGCLDLLSPVQTKESNFSNYNNKKSDPAPVWLSFNNQEQKVCYGHAGWVDTVVMKPAPPLPQPPPPRRPEVVSYVTVECVTDTWVESEGLGCTDEERVRNMEKDSCPGFISDGQDKVVWTNMAYRQMAGVGDVFGGEDMTVVLIRKDKWTTTSPLLYPAFTCKLRVTSSTSHNHRQTSSQMLTMPCDVWRMECGACAWRLDVKAALSLGR